MESAGASLSVESVAYVEELYCQYLADPTTVPDAWRRYFREAGIEPAFRRPAEGLEGTGGGTDGSSELEAIVRQDRVDQLVRAYRVRGHMVADIDPLGLPREPQPELDPGYYGLTAEDLDRSFSVRTVAGAATRTLREIVQLLNDTYCRSIGVQFMHIDDADAKAWLQERMESSVNRIRLPRAEQVRVLTKLTDAVLFEEFIQRKFLGAKSFSLEGCESLIPLLMFAIDHAATMGVEEVVLGMPHRGRLNVLANIMGKPPSAIFNEFQDKGGVAYGSGDVKYHLGYSSDWRTPDGRSVHLSLCFNPSHLEFVGPVVMGRVRAKQDRLGDTERSKVLPLVMHGDSAFAGEGVVQESLNLSELNAYHVGGTLHVVVNNQIGFTTLPRQGRSCTYATDVAKMLQIPVFHVNGEDPEAVAQTVELALAFRSEFHKDVIIDMYGYRRHGHNESDEPAFTQPVLYRLIAELPSVRDAYLRRLAKLGELGEAEGDAIAVEALRRFEEELLRAQANEGPPPPVEPFSGAWRGYAAGRLDHAMAADTALPRETLVELLGRLVDTPADFQAHGKIKRFLQGRGAMAEGKNPVDWGGGEALAFASLLTEGRRIRLTGQDAERGTFSHRHAVLHDVETGNTFCPFHSLTPGVFDVENSPLSEVAVLAFEYGYSLDFPEAFVGWEAQFGDFANVAQVIVDQFISSAEAKWNRLTGLTLLLPHGMEGQGPEHSSARIERFLTSAAEDNMIIAQPSTPAQLFHLLRRQVLWRVRKPLVVFTPKSLLRHPQVVSPLEEFTSGTFRSVLIDEKVDREAVRRVIFCTGKAYYELSRQREELVRSDVALVRVEQLYPLATDEVRAAMAHYPRATEVRWVQEEPENMGAWRYFRHRFGEALAPYGLRGVTRPEAASPAVGSGLVHRRQQQELLTDAFA